MKCKKILDLCTSVVHSMSGIVMYGIEKKDSGEYFVILESLSINTKNIYSIGKNNKGVVLDYKSAKTVLDMYNSMDKYGKSKFIYTHPIELIDFCLKHFDR